MIHEKAITLKQLRALAAIVRAGNLTAAAAELHVTTPAVSTQLRLLEDNLGVGLLTRGPDGRVEVTAPGAEVLQAVAKIENTLDGCYKRVGALKEGKAGHVVLGVVSTAKYFAPFMVKQASDALPGLEIDLRIGNREAIIDGLRADEYDIAIMGRPPREPLVEATVLGDHPHIVIAAPDHPLVGLGDVPADRLLEETFLCREIGSGTRILMERYLDRIGDGRPYAKYELGTNETIKQAVIAGLGIALISAHTVIAELESCRLATIAARRLPIIRQWFLVHPHGQPLSPAAERLRDFLVGHKGDFLPDFQFDQHVNGQDGGQSF